MSDGPSDASSGYKGPLRPAYVGDLRERVTFQALTDTGGVYDWTNLKPQTWARVTPISGQFAFRQTSGAIRRRFTITIRYDASVEYPGRALWRGKTLEVQDVTNVDERRDWFVVQTVESLATAISRQIEQVGVPITLRRYTNAPISGSTPWLNTASASDIATKGLIEAYGINEINGSVVLAGDRRIAVATDIGTWSGVKPLPGDEVILSDGTVTRVMAVDRISPLDPIEAYSLQVRG